MTLQDSQGMRAGYRPGYALPRSYYTSPAIYDRDIRDYWNRSWIWVGHESQIANPGDYFLFDYGPESIIVARDRDGRIGAFQNVCRHRGSRVCLERSGNARVLSCPYHAWTYELNGNLRAAAAMPEGFDRARHGLLPVHLRNVAGLLFACAAETPPAVDDGLARLEPLLAPFGLRDTRIAHTASYTVPADWKLAVENYMECYHCACAHPDFARSHSIKDPKGATQAQIAALHDASRAAGLPIDEVQHYQPGTASLYYRRYPLLDGYRTGSRTGAPLAPLLGNLTAFDGGATDLQIGIINNFLIYSDHMVGYRFVPTGLQQTEIQIVWLVRADAQEGRDYDLDELTWLWHVTSLDDERIIRHNQEGVNSHHFVPGPLSQMEWGITAFYDDYFALTDG